MDFYSIQLKLNIQLNDRRHVSIKFAPLPKKLVTAGRYCDTVNEQKFRLLLLLKSHLLYFFLFLYTTFCLLPPPPLHRIKMQMTRLIRFYPAASRIKRERELHNESFHNNNNKKEFLPFISTFLAMCDDRFGLDSDLTY